MDLSGTVTTTGLLLPTVIIAQENFDANDCGECTLCFEIDESRFRFCVIKETSSQCLWLEDYAFDTFLNEEDFLTTVKNLVSNHRFLATDQWKNIRVAVNTHSFTLIPGTLFRKEYASDYLQFATGRSLFPNERVLYKFMPGIDAFSIFSLPAHWSDWLQNQYPFQQVDFFHLTSPLITGTLTNQAQPGESQVVTLHLEADYFTMILVENQSLKFCNRFPYQSPAELTYLILFCLNQLHVVPETIQMILYGEITPYADLYIELARFIPELHFGKNPEGLNYLADFEDIPEHRYFGLLNTFLF
ncbi:DUF3822 family protein [Arundinibacter roseus]|uniref:DUF3822 family protein n=1 Tax=Arundinibacter roseus TaxID=2070510 RepID=A0A4R4K9L6_9BACT|nr:DUF3822 family protein [Arundinibacter roseus]TDB64514.1 DUF3822 family protein [Arundinibacter roseus]